MNTTEVNPASFKKVISPSIFYVLKKFLNMILLMNIKGALYFIITTIINFINQIKSKNHYYCNVCDTSSAYFIHTSNKYRISWSSICPNCNSRKRHRGLYKLYQIQLEKMQKPIILHFAPEPVLYHLFNHCEYITADISLDDVNLQLDIEKIDYQSESFDLLLCNHVLEHVKKDIVALRELNRILTINGVLILTVPGNWRIEKTRQFKETDQNGHYRDYGLDFVSVLENIFNHVKVIDLAQYNHKYILPLGIEKNHDLAFHCSKI